jgi:hypothetical protein
VNDERALSHRSRGAVAIATCRSASEVMFEYVLTEEFVDDIGREYKAIFSPLVGSLGEPAQTEWAPTEAERVVTGCGLRIADHPSRDERVSRYFADRTDGLRGSSMRGD